MRTTSLKKSILRFWAGVERTDDCWTWQRSTVRSGHGHIWWFGTMRTTHRVSYELEFGPIPDGQVVRHRCDNPPCVRPDHLELGTVADNNRDMWERGTPITPDNAGARNGMALLTSDRVKQIRELRSQGAPVASIAEDFGVSISTVYKIARGSRWAAA